jgi:hypothetical protein
VRLGFCQFFYHFPRTADLHARFQILTRAVRSNIIRVEPLEPTCGSRIVPKTFRYAVVRIKRIFIFAGLFTVSYFLG